MTGERRHEVDRWCRRQSHDLRRRVNRLRVPFADRRHQLGQWYAERVRDPVERADFGRYSARLHLDDRLTMHTGQLREKVDRHASLVSETRDADAEGSKVGDGGGHPINADVGASIAQ